MAAALRKVTQNYNWTLKRADNDLRNVITTPQPQTSSPASPSHQDIELVDSSGAFLWDANRLRLKLGTDYEELREHLGRSLLILLSWIVSVYHLLKAAAWHFVGHHSSSVVRHYEEGIKLANLDVSATSVWNLSVSLLRSAASLVVSLLWEIICFFVPLNVKPYAKDGTRFASWLLEQPALALVSVKGLKGLSDAKSPAKNMDNTAEDATRSQLTESLADTLKVGIKAMHTMADNEARQLFHIKPLNYNYPENLHEYAKAFTGTLASYRSFLS